MQTISNSRGDSNQEFLAALGEKKVPSLVRQQFYDLLKRLSRDKLSLRDVCSTIDPGRRIYELDCWEADPMERSTRPWAAIALVEGVLVLLHVRAAFTGGAAERDMARSEAIARFDMEYPS